MISGLGGNGFEQDLRVDPSNPTRIYTSAPGSLSSNTSWIWRSLDSGKTFKWIPGSTPLTGKAVVCAGGGDTELGVDSAGHVYFADLTLGMVMIHLFTFDPDWLRPDRAARPILLFDGECALCHGAVRFLSQEDSHDVLRYAPLGLVVRCQQDRRRSVNRFLALRELVDQAEIRISPESSKRLRDIERKRSNKARAGRRARAKHQGPTPPAEQPL